MGILDSVLGPSDESKQLFAELQKRWKAVLDWGLKKKVPNVHANWESWEVFQRAWLTGEQDVTALSAQASDLNTVEAYAKEKGFDPSGPPVVAPDIETASGALKGAAAVEHFVQDLPKAPPAPSLGDLWNKLPLWGKGAVVLGGVTLAASAVNNVKDALPGRRRR